MKKHIHLTGIWLWVALLALMVACDPKEKVMEPMEKPLPELVTIDSLMWRQPDSAFAVLRQFVASPQADSLDEFNGHYCQLLISELLYKNYYGQSNREGLLHAVDYFDSLTLTLNDTPAPKRLIVGTTPLSLTRNDNIVFLDARAHYINGAGFYEQGDMVQACAEYLKALGLMEEHFEEQAIIGKRAQFMANTYNRLGDMFSEQFMMESSIACYENALVYCKIEPTSPIGVSNILYRIGKQYDKKNEIENARLYYSQALDNMTATDNMVYRDIVASKALCDYKVEGEAKYALDELSTILTQANTENERLNRYLTTGCIFFFDGNYDSALFYFEPVFENQKAGLQDQAANYIYIIYKRQGDRDKADSLMHFLASRKKLDGDNKALVSKLEDMFKDYMNQKQEKEAEDAREKSIRKTIEIIVPIAFMVALAVFIVVKLRSKQLLKKQQEDADRKFGESEQQHRMEQAAISGRLKRSNQEVRELKDQIKQLDDLAAKTETAASFNEEPICRLIMERVHDGQFKSKIDYIIYKDSALDKQQLLDLRLAVDHHFGQFTVRLKKAFPELTNSDLDYCCLYLLGLTDADVAALMQRTYNTVFERSGKIRKIIGRENSLPVTLIGMAKDSLSI